MCILLLVEPGGAARIMGNPQTTHPPALEEQLKSDPRWRLLDRILATPPFQKSSRLPSLLCYLAEHSLCGRAEELTEQRIGTAIFGKAADYSPSEDSAVRVHVRQLRLRLHEYFACEGRDEPIIVDIPKGSYELVFHSANPRPVQPEVHAVVREPAPPKKQLLRKDMFLVGALLALLVCSIGWYRAARAAPDDTQVPWPVSAVIEKNAQTKVVVTDGSSMLRLLTRKNFTLEDYLGPGFLASITPPRMDDNLSRLVKYISDSQITSFADTMMASTLVQLAGSRSQNILVCTARDLNRRDLEQGNFIFVGGPTSNPWVSLFADKLNFQVVEDGVGGNMYFLNKKPLPGEQLTYQGLRYTGSGGEDYATIALLPSSSGQGNVLILQGLREEGTEALGILLGIARDRDELRHALHIPDGSHTPVYFEALVRARTVAGAPVSISIVTTRIVRP
ncbi:MAG TPA: hypothetical protein VHX37_05565 [Acidobacteriaceae bacterium]|nr:hypothetical protein [Acidobacteriaceae bacterium]